MNAIACDTQGTIAYVRFRLSCSRGPRIVLPPMSSMHVYQPETELAELEPLAGERAHEAELPQASLAEGSSSELGDPAASDAGASDAGTSDAGASDAAASGVLSCDAVGASGAFSSEAMASEAVVSRVVSRGDTASPAVPGSGAPGALPPPSTPASPVLPSASDWVSRELHREALERFVPRGARVLELSPGGGTFTEVLHRMGCKISLCSASLEELEASRSRAAACGFTDAVEASYQRGIAALDGIADETYDAVVAYHGALSHALERRDRALSECMRVLRPRGLLVLSVGSLWGTLHRGLPAVLARDLVQNRAIIRSGNAPLTLLGGGWRAPQPSGVAAAAEVSDERGHGPGQCHLFRAAELEAFLRRGGLELLFLSASSALSTGVALPNEMDSSTWSALLEYERAACVERGYLDSGSHLIAVCRR